MVAAVEALGKEPGMPSIFIDVLDVDADPELVSRFDELVPVLVTADDTELCHYHLDAAKVREYLGTFR